MQGNRTDIVVKDVDGGAVERLTTRPSPSVYVHSWAPDGSALAFSEDVPGTASDIWVLPLTGDRQPILLLTSRFFESDPEFSRDGRWLAYTSSESGQVEVYVRPYPGTGGEKAISTEADTHPRGLRRERSSSSRHPGPGGMMKMVAVPVTTGSTFSAGTPQVLFESAYYNPMFVSTMSLETGATF
jgi:dipeptidyl aminopeptidase/acylaminoacyl peptidase